MRKIFGMRKNFLGSNATLLPRFFCRCSILETFMAEPVIFLYWVEPVPYFRAEPVKKVTLYDLKRCVETKMIVWSPVLHSSLDDLVFNIFAAQASQVWQGSDASRT